MSRRAQRPGSDPGVEIRSYAPHGDLTPRTYELPPHLTRLEENFRAIVRKFLQNTRADEFNASYLDGVIAAAEQEALADLARQRANHRGAAIQLVERLWQGDRIKAEARLAQNREELEECRLELERLERVFYRGTSLARAEAPVMKKEEME